MNDIIDIIEQYYFNKTNKKLIDEYKCSVVANEFIKFKLIFFPKGNFIGLNGHVMYRLINYYTPIQTFHINCSRTKGDLPDNYWWSSGKNSLEGFKND